MYSYFDIYIVLDYFTQDQSISLMENLSGKMSDMSRDTVSVSENSFSMKTVKTAYYSCLFSIVLVEVLRVH